ncbi:MAG: methylmalonyl Co-A mutase-associated GTPase MeaB [Bacteroidota bacterium]
MFSQLLHDLQQGSKKALARAISLVENDSTGYESLLEELTFSKTIPLIGITGPPGAGKSTLINAFAKYLTEQNKKVAIIAIDPSSPFNKGSLMGDRLRMSEHFLNPNIFIRSMASRGSLGGLAPKIFEVADLLKAAQFDYIIIETVGVGQSEVEIASLADTTVLVLVPEAGDDIQTIKSGVMEIADVYVLNKADRSGADIFYKNLCALAHNNATENWETPVIKTVASKYEGLDLLNEAILKYQSANIQSKKKQLLLAEKAIMLIKNQRVKDIRFDVIFEELKEISQLQNFNIYRYVKKYI